MEIKSTPNAISLTVAAHRVSAVESITLRAKRQMISIGEYGRLQPSSFCEGTAAYEVELNRVRLPVSEGFDKLDFFALDNFLISIERDGKQIDFMGCRWIQIEETLSEDECLLQKVVLIAKSLGVS